MFIFKQNSDILNCFVYIASYNQNYYYGPNGNYPNQQYLQNNNIQQSQPQQDLKNINYPPGSASELFMVLIISSLTLIIISLISTGLCLGCNDLFLKAYDKVFYIEMFNAQDADNILNALESIIQIYLAIESGLLVFAAIGLYFFYKKYMNIDLFQNVRLILYICSFTGGFWLMKLYILYYLVYPQDSSLIYPSIYDVLLEKFNKYDYKKRKSVSLSEYQLTKISEIFYMLGVVNIIVVVSMLILFSVCSLTNEIYCLWLLWVLLFGYVLTFILTVFFGWLRFDDPLERHSFWKMFMIFFFQCHDNAEFSELADSILKLFLVAFFFAVFAAMVKLPFWIYK